MNTKENPPVIVFLLGCLLLMVPGCGLFEPREPEPPTQSSFDFRPPTTPGAVIANLQSAVAQKNVANYANCFRDPARPGRTFRFEPSADASVQYPNILNNWTFADEEAYFQNLVAKAQVSPPGLSNLLLLPLDSLISPDSVMLNFDYTFTFEHNEPGFDNTARGNLQFSLAVESGYWMIYHWKDFQTTNAITWSAFKGKFSN